MFFEDYPHLITFQMNLFVLSLFSIGVSKFSFKYKCMSIEILVSSYGYLKIM